MNPYGQHKAFGPVFPGLQEPERTLTVKEHNDLMMAERKDLLLIVLLGAVVILLWALRKRRGGDWE